MARFYGPVGFGEAVKTAPGVTKDVITEKNFFGDVLRNNVKSENAQSVNANVTVNNTISIVANTYAIDHLTNIRYIKWLGKNWEIDSIDVELPRLIFRLGGVYRGPTPTTPGPV
jgi:hypothetical protein